MKVISASEARNNFSEILSLVVFKGESFIVKRKGKIVARIMPEKLSKKKDEEKEIKEKLKAIKELSRFSLGILDDWKEAEKILDDLHTPHF